jgi:hypothetical protein
MINAASAASSIFAKSGPIVRIAGRLPYLRSSRTRASITEVLELESAASVRISRGLVFEISKMLRTGPRLAMPTSRKYGKAKR